MFKLRYNILAFLQVVINLINYALFMKIFGISQSADTYLLALAIFSSLQLFQHLAIEQFIFFYNDIKARDIISSHKFYHASLGVSIIVGICSYIFGYLGLDFITSFFVGALDAERLDMIKIILGIAFIELIFSPILALNQKLLNAEMHFSLPYILTMLPILVVMSTTLYMFFYKITVIEFLVYAKLYGTIIATIVSIIVVSRYIPVGIRLSHPQLLPFLKNSFTMRFGHNIHNFLFTPITTNILSMLPSSFAAYFYYAYRIVGIVITLVIGPSYNLFQAKLAQAWSHADFSSGKRLIYQYLKTVFPLLIISSILCYILLPFIIPIINKDLLSRLSLIQELLIGLMIWQMIIVAESGYVAILINNKNSMIFIITNSLFAAIYFIVAYYTYSYYGIFAIPIAVIVGQIINFIIYAYYSIKFLEDRNS